MDTVGLSEFSPAAWRSRKIVRSHAPATFSPAGRPDARPQTHRCGVVHRRPDHRAGGEPPVVAGAAGGVLAPRRGARKTARTSSSARNDAAAGRAKRAAKAREVACANSLSADPSKVCRRRVQSEAPRHRLPHPMPKGYSMPLHPPLWLGGPLLSSFWYTQYLKHLRAALRPASD